MRTSLVAVSVAAALLLGACAPELESSIHVTDVLKVADGGAPMTTPALFRVPQTSADNCKAGLDKLIENLSALAPTTGKGTCIEKNGDNLAEIETSMVIASPGGEIPSPNLFVLEVGADEMSMSGGQTLTFRLLDTIDNITKALAANSDELSADFDPAVFTFKLTNDSPGAIAFMPNHVFVDGEPGLPEMGATALDTRDSVEIKLSDVASAYVERSNAFAFATIARK